MARFHATGEGLVQYTAEEETARDAEEKAYKDSAGDREMAEIRTKRDKLLVETDWMANSDVTMSDAWKAYRKALRDVPAQADMDNITWPTKP